MIIVVAAFYPESIARLAGQVPGPHDFLIDTKFIRRMPPNKRGCSSPPVEIKIGKCNYDHFLCRLTARTKKKKTSCKQ